MLTVKDFENQYLGRKFGKLTVIGKATGEREVLFVKVKCDCGTVREMLLNNIIYGFSRSCGCVRALTVSRARRMGSKLFVNTSEGAKSLVEIADEYDVPYTRLHSRFLKGITTVKELVSGTRRGYRPEEPDARLNGMSNKAASVLFELKKQTVSDRLKRGWIVNTENKWVTKQGVVLEGKFLRKPKTKNYDRRTGAQKTKPKNANAA